MLNYPAIITDGQEEKFYLNKAIILVAVKEATTVEAINKMVAKLGLSTMTIKSKKPKKGEENVVIGESIYHTSKRFWLNFKGGNFTQAVIEKLEVLLTKNLDWVAPVYSLGKKHALDTTFAVIPNVLILNKKVKNQDKLTQYLTHDKKKLRRSKKYNFFELNKNKFTDVLQLVDSFRLEASSFILDRMPILSPYFAWTPNDGAVNNQWYLEQTDLDQAWEYSIGHRNMVIGIIDTGCDLNHGDLDPKYINNGENMEHTNLNGGLDNLTYTLNDPDRRHGSRVAGVAAAVFNNGGNGIAGVGGNTRILPIALGTIQSSAMADAITECIEQDVDIVNMSFGVGFRCNVGDEAIDDAIDAGLLLVAATGRDGSNRLPHPARNPNVMAIGATDIDDLHFDGVSNYARPNYKYKGVNSGVSVCAPGVDILTTDIRIFMLSGFFEDLYGTRSGTSFAAPQAAGVAALIKSLNPSLTNIQIRDIIEQTAARVGGYNYQNHNAYPNGPRHKKMGYGRLNAGVAVQKAKPMHLTTVTGAGQIKHSIRFGFSNGWQSVLGDVEGQTGAAGNFVDVDCTLDYRGLHVIGITDDGATSKLVRAVRNPRGGWTSPFVDVQNVIGIAGKYERVACCTNAGRLTVVMTDSAGHLYLVERNAANAIVTAMDLNTEINGATFYSFVDVSCAMVGTSLHICAVTNDGKLMHIVRLGNGTFQHYFGTLNTSNLGAITKVSCTGIYSSLHVVCTTSGGTVHHIERRFTGSWSSWTNVASRVAPISSVVDVSCSTVGINELHLCVVTAQKELFHTIGSFYTIPFLPFSFAQSAWQSFWGSIGQLYNNPNEFVGVGIG